MPDRTHNPDFRAHPDRTAPETDNVLDAIVEEGRLGATPERREESKSWLKDFVSSISHGATFQNNDVGLLVENRIQDLDRLIATQINQVLHHPDFQDLESVWRGLSYLVQETAEDQNVALQICSARARDLAESEFQSQLRDLTISERLGSLGADPFSALIGIYEFTRDPAHIRVLRQLGQLAADARSAFLTEAHSSILGSGSLDRIFRTHGSMQELELDDIWQHLVHDRVAKHLLLASPGC